MQRQMNERVFNGWQRVQRALHLTPDDSWDNLQSLCNPEHYKVGLKIDEWIDGSLMGVTGNSCQWKNEYEQHDINGSSNPELMRK